ncbi:hypothetical protein [Phenylobacterium sp.]|uniref:hypothetical protein n=1 Tax=Phenylobacterium sp. TaxID=1871053 RepID=UPI0011FFDEDC|nr:hypothetical protein [Phenylobacterium sp.]THD61385.1 MAG: hypothetical protein E8A49_10325 [Phenylobacterium sp.]
MRHLLLAPTFAAAAVLAVTLAAGAAGAETPTRLDLSLPSLTPGAALEAPVTAKGLVAEKPAPDLANPLDPHAPTKIQTADLNSEVFAKTAVDHHFGPGDAGGATASAGFLCGLQPGHGDNGGAAAYGIDPHGRFVGAKLSFAF